MKRKILSLLLALTLMSGMALPAFADTFYGGSNWAVRFTTEKKMVSSFRSTDIDDAVAGLQPGDRIIMTVKLTNEYLEATDWYMTNKVLYSLEDRSKNAATYGGAYTYDLRYTNAAGSVKILYSSDTVGGETVDASGKGLHEATNSLDDFFYLDTLSNGQSGVITLTISLDGETQGNDYQDTLADLQMNFAVELSGKTVKTTSPKTGDTMMTTPYLIAAAISGLVLLILAVISMRRPKRRGKREWE